MSRIPNWSRLPRLFVSWKHLPVLTGLALCLALYGNSAWGQDKEAAPAQPAAAAPAAAAPGAPAPAAPEDVTLTTDDGLDLNATYFAGTKGQESIPVIIIHGLGLKDSSKDFTQAGGLAEYLQENLGCAVIVPDLRGHGESTNWSAEKIKELKDNHKRPLKPLKAADLKPLDCELMIRQDLIAVKDFLWKKNNDKMLNLNKLVVIGVDEGAILALNYAYYDALGYDYQGGEAYYDKAHTVQLGDFVKGVVLISPPHISRKVKNLALKNPAFCIKLPVMIVAGNQDKENFPEAERLHNIFIGQRPKLEKPKAWEITVWFYSKIETKLHGTKMLDETSLKIPDKIKSFTTARLIENPFAKEWTWKTLKHPHE